MIHSNWLLYVIFFGRTMVVVFFITIQASRPSKLSLHHQVGIGASLPDQVVERHVRTKPQGEGINVAAEVVDDEGLGDAPAQHVKPPDWSSVHVKVKHVGLGPLEHLEIWTGGRCFALWFYRQGKHYLI